MKSNYNKPKTDYEITVDMQKKMAAYIKNNLIKEEEVRFPNMGDDIKADIDEFNSNMSGYLNKFDNRNSHKFYQSNVIFNGKSIVKNIEFSWSYSLDEEGCVISLPTSISSFPLYNEIIQFFDDLKVYYVIWKNKWTEKYSDLSNKM